jgi:hypothetical protein
LAEPDLNIRCGVLAVEYPPQVGVLGVTPHASPLLVPLAQLCLQGGVLKWNITSSSFAMKATTLTDTKHLQLILEFLPPRLFCVGCGSGSLSTLALTRHAREHIPGKALTHTSKIP